MAPSLRMGALIHCSDSDGRFRSRRASFRCRGPKRPTITGKLFVSAPKMPASTTYSMGPTAAIIATASTPPH